VLEARDREGRAVVPRRGGAGDDRCVVLERRVGAAGVRRLGGRREGVDVARGDPRRGPLVELRGPQVDGEVDGGEVGLSEVVDEVPAPEEEDPVVVERCEGAPQARSCAANGVVPRAFNRLPWAVMRMGKRLTPRSSRPSSP